MKVGDEVEVKEKSKQLALVLEANALAERDVPDYIEVDHAKMTAKLTRVPAARRRALPGADGAAPRGRVLLALARCRTPRYPQAVVARFAEKSGELRDFCRAFARAT